MPHNTEYGTCRHGEYSGTVPEPGHFPSLTFRISDWIGNIDKYRTRSQSEHRNPEQAIGIHLYCSDGFILSNILTKNMSKIMRPMISIGQTGKLPPRWTSTHGMLPPIWRLSRRTGETLLTKDPLMALSIGRSKGDNGNWGHHRGNL